MNANDACSKFKPIAMGESSFEERTTIKQDSYSTPVTLSNSLPAVGEPGSSQVLPNPDGTPKQKRWYGPDGKPIRDRDYNHPGDVPFPHDHEWEDGKRKKEHLPPSPDYEMTTNPLLGLGLLFVSLVGIGYVVINDVTGVGAADDALLPVLSTGVSTGWFMIFGY